MNWPLRSFFLIAAVLFGIANLPWQLDDYDQAKQAFTSYEMIEGGAWFYQHSPKGEAATKPPLAGWLSAALYVPLRSWDVAWRLPSFAAALLLLWLLAREGGLLAGAAFAFNGFTPRLATLVRTDMLLALWMALIGLRIYQKIRAREPWTARDRWFVFACVLASMMTKGPILYAFLFPGLLAFWLLARGRKKEAAAWAWSGWWPWLLPLAGFGAWAIGGIYLDPAFYQRVVVEEFLGRFQTGTTAIHEAKPFYAYVAKLMAMFAPWMWLLLAFPFVPALRRKVAARPELLWLLCWCVGGLVVMSLIPSKRADRIFPLLPPACLLLGVLLAPEASTPLRWRRLAQAAGIVAMVGTVFYAGWNIVEDVRERSTALVAFGRQARAYATAHGQPLAVVSGNDQGLPLYAGLLHSLSEKDALRAWKENARLLLAVPKTTWERRREDFREARVILEAPKTEATFNEFVLLTR